MCSMLLSVVYAYLPYLLSGLIRNPATHDVEKQNPEYVISEPMFVKTSRSDDAQGELLSIVSNRSLFSPYIEGLRDTCVVLFRWCVHFGWCAGFAEALDGEEVFGAPISSALVKDGRRVRKLPAIVSVAVEWVDKHGMSSVSSPL